MGGGATNLAWKRSASSRAASRNVRTLFRINDSDYGAPINIEGDIAGYCIGATNIIAAPNFSPNKKIADLFREFLPVSRSSRSAYAQRCRNFISMLGGSFRGAASNHLINKSALVSILANKIKKFTEVYMLQRYILTQGIPRDRVKRACTQIPGCAREVATVFVNALVNGVATPRRFVRGVGPWPTPPAASCSSLALQAASREQEATQAVEDMLEETRREATRFLRELERETSRRARELENGLDQLRQDAENFIN
jgi:hypothetical protein